MQIKVNRIKKMEEGTVKAYVDLLIEDTLVVKDVKVMDGANGLFVAMPSKKGSDGNYYDSVHPITAEGRDAINKVVMDAYNNA